MCIVIAQREAGSVEIDTKCLDLKFTNHFYDN